MWRTWIHTSKLSKWNCFSNTSEIRERNYDNSKGRAFSTTPPTPVYLKVRIRWKSHLALLGSGCNVTLIQNTIATDFVVHLTIETCTAANGRKIPILEWFSIPAQTGDVPVDICRLVTAYVTEIMLASQFVRYYEMNWNFAAAEITF